MMNFYEHEIEIITSRLRVGQAVLFPSDTVWQLGCDAFNEKAVQHLYTIKHKPTSEKMILLVSDDKMLAKYVKNVHPRIHALNDYHEQPVTVIYQFPVDLPDYLLEEDGSIAIRIVKNEFCAKLIAAFGKPILSTSANMHGELTPANFSEISATIRKKVDYEVQYSQNETTERLHSVIVELNEKEEFDFLRD